MKSSGCTLDERVIDCDQYCAAENRRCGQYLRRPVEGTNAINSFCSNMRQPSELRYLHVLRIAGCNTDHFGPQLCGNLVRLNAVKGPLSSFEMQRLWLTRRCVVSLKVSGIRTTTSLGTMSRRWPRIMSRIFAGNDSNDDTFPEFKSSCCVRLSC